MNRSALWITLLAAVAGAAALAAGPAGLSAERPGAQAQKGQWVNISDALVAKLAEQGAKPGYAGPTAGIAVDRASGDVFLVINDQGLYRSGDRGATWARCDEKTVGGRCETGFGIDADPAGKRLAVFVVYGSSALTLDGGATWIKSKLSHIDAVASDWTDCCSLVALRHESGGTIALSGDGGQTWKDLGKGFKGVGLFDARTLVATKEKEGGIFRSTDGGENWSRVSDLNPSGLAMRTFRGAGYWVSDAGLLVSKDKGATWAVQGAPLKMVQGPYFGKDESHIVVLTKEGFQETADGGKTWNVAAPLPPDTTADRMTTCAWDVKANLFYVSRMTKPAYKFER
ncbi:MAG: sialidase family protein [Planctomycetota bacterium]|nr:sialidase family protein [Planctomycetota bacterium]